MCFDEILEFYNDQNRSNLSTELWYNRYLVKLMNALSSDRNDQKIRNCLLLLLNLFKARLPDHYHNKGRSFKELQNEDRKSLIKLLEIEFLDQ